MATHLDTHFTRMKAAVSRASYGVECSYTTADMKKVFIGLLREFTDDLSRAIEEVTGEKNVAYPAYENGADEIDDAFDKIIAAEEAEEEARREDICSDRRHDERRDHEAMGWVS